MTDPFRRKNHKMVMCETFLVDKSTPARYNFRTICEKIMEEAKHEDPWFGMEQEFFIYRKAGATYEWPLGFPLGGYPFP